MNQNPMNEEFDSQLDNDDLALDSVLREYSESCTDGEAFLSRVEGRLDPDQFCGRASLMDQVGEASTTSAEGSTPPTIPRDSQSQTGGRNFVAVLLTCAAAVLIALGGSVWMLSGIGESSPGVAVAVADAEGGTDVGIAKTIDTVDEHLLVEERPERLENLAAPTVVENRPDKSTDGVGANSNTNRIANMEQPTASASSLDTHAHSEPVYSGPDPNWTLSIKFDNENKRGTVSINDEVLHAKIPGESFDLVLARIQHEVARRVHFLSPVLEKSWVGRVEFIGPALETDARFVGLDEMYDSIGALRKRVAESTEFASTFDATKKPIKLPNPREFFSAVTASRMLWQAAQWNKFDLPVIEECVNETESILKDWLGEEMSSGGMTFVQWGQRSKSKRFQNYRSITLPELEKFADTGRLTIPAATDSFLLETSIQNLDPIKLKNQLAESTVEIGIYRDRSEFRSAHQLISDTTVAGSLNFQAEQLEFELEEVRKRMAPIVKKKNETNNRLDQKKYERELRHLSIEQEKLWSRRSKLLKQANLAARTLRLKGAEGMEPVEPLAILLPNRKDLQGLNLVMGDACHLDSDNAKTLHFVSVTSGRILQEFDRFGARNFDKHTKSRMKTIKDMIANVAANPKATQALRTLDQMLQIEGPELRLELVKALHRTNSEIGCGLLTCYARYDLDPEVRVAAVDALRSYPAELYRSNLLDGFQYPWPEVAKHSAEALVRLNDTDAVPALVELLNRPDPRVPRRKGEDIVQRELVAINHMKNCTLCHADSQSPADPGRGLIPVWGNRLSEQYYQAPQGATVRADVTYLRQDFSVIQRVKDAAPWPENQRFDYVVRETIVSHAEGLAIADKLSRQPNQYHAAIVKALRLLTKENPKDDSYQTWKAIVSKSAAAKSAAAKSAAANRAPR